MPVAPLVLQLNVLLAPALTLGGLAENSLIVGATVGFAVGGLVTPEQPANPIIKAIIVTTRNCKRVRDANRLAVPRPLPCSALAHTAMPTRLRLCSSGLLLVGGTGLDHCRGGTGSALLRSLQNPKALWPSKIDVRLELITTS
jgi:hypothetical protein